MSFHPKGYPPAPEGYEYDYQVVLNDIEWYLKKIKPKKQKKQKDITSTITK